MTLTKDQKEFIKVLNNALGIVSLALQETGYKRVDYEEWMENPLFEEEVLKINDTSLDYVENQLIKEIKKGNMSAIQFYLKTKGKDRGYT
jgi:hypothetical protein